jgi:hypothetical protein
MGVNKKNLETYSETFQFIMQSRIDKIPREERFMRVLSSLVMRQPKHFPNKRGTMYSRCE